MSQLFTNALTAKMFTKYGGARAYTRRYAVYENDHTSPMYDYVAYYESSPYYRFDKERPDFYESLDEGYQFGNGSYFFDSDSFISLEYAKSVLEEYLTVHKKRFQKEAAWYNHANK